MYFLYSPHELMIIISALTFQRPLHHGSGDKYYEGRLIDESRIKEQVCVQKQENVTSAVLSAYKCVQQRIGKQQEPLLDSCWDRESGYPGGRPKEDAAWLKLYCDNEFHYVHKILAERCFLDPLITRNRSLCLRSLLSLWRHDDQRALPSSHHARDLRTSSRTPDVLIH